MNTTILFDWIEERESIRLKRLDGLSAPWTDDHILREWSFTNARRQDDRTTRWVTEYVRKPHLNNPDLFFALVVAVFVNNIGSLEELLGCLLPFDPDRFLAVMKARADRGERLYSPAYMIRADKKYRTTAAYQVEKVFTPLWRARERMRPRAETLDGYCSRLSERHGFGGGFMTGQVIAYLKYAPPLCNAKDWDTFVISGPGSKRGLNRVFGHPPDRKWSSEAAWRAAFNQLRAAIAPDLERMGLSDLHAQDLQNCLCEFDKYERVRLGEGKPRRRFKPSPDPLPGSGLAEAAE